MSFGKVQLKQASYKVIFQGLCTTNCISVYICYFVSSHYVHRLFARAVWDPPPSQTTSHHREGNSKIDSLKSAEHKFSAFRIISRIITFYEAGGSSPVSKHGCGRHESFEGFRGQWLGLWNKHTHASTH